MHKVNCILLLSLTLAFSLGQLVNLQRAEETWIPISQQIGDGIKNVPIPPPWYFLQNKYYSNANTGSNLATAKPTTTAKVELEPYTTKYQVPNLGSSPKYQVPTVWSTAAVTTSTERIPPQTDRLPIYQLPTSTILPTTPNSVNTIAPLSNRFSGSDNKETNAHSGPIYTSEYPNVSELTTEIPKLPFNNSQSSESSGLQQKTTIQSQVLENGEKDLEKVTEALLTDNSQYLSQTTSPDPSYANNAMLSDNTTLTNNVALADNAALTDNVALADNIALADNAALADTTLADNATLAANDSATSNAGSLNFNPGLLFSGPQICKNQNAYFGVGENHSFYVECNDYQPSLKLCPENTSFDSNVQWPQFPCLQTASENQAQTQ